MKYNSFIKVDEKFQTSINLEYDLNKIDKIQSYIPTEQSVKILGSFLRSVYYSQEQLNRATVLIGPYGRGKSHLLLIYTALTSMGLYDTDDSVKTETSLALDDLCDKIGRVDDQVGALAKAVRSADIRLLPIVVNSNTTDINQAFIIALREALNLAGLSKLLPDTNFDVAAAVIDKWKVSFPDAYAKMSNELKQRKINTDELYIKLKQYDQDSYLTFCECYPNITAGSEFNPFINMDIIKLYTSVVAALTEQTSFSGINIIFDEFSKFLETNLDASKMRNFKIIQDMAETATRSRYKQIHFTCITHKEILDYSSSDSFKTVEGRFRKVRFVASSEQSYDLIANAISKTAQFDIFKETHKEIFTQAIQISSVADVFSDVAPSGFEKKLVYGCFPLSPLSAFALLRVSEKVGQNERTLFTFLAQRDQYTLATFIEQDHEGVQFLTVENIYDYFEDLFKREVFSASVHNIWAKTDSALRQVNDANQQKVLKAIAVINIISDERLKPIPAHIKAALMMDDDVFYSAENILMRQHIIAQRDSSEFVLLTANGIDIQKNVDKYIKSKLSRVTACEVLMDTVDLGYVMPREYNDKYCMLRYFKNIFMDASTFMHCKNAQQLLIDNPYDGLIIYLINTTSENLNSIEKKIRSFNNYPQIILCLTNGQWTYDTLLKKLVAIRSIKTSQDALLDFHYLDEVEVYEEDVIKQIRSVIATLYAPNSAHSFYLNCNGRLPLISKQVELNHEISNICGDCYCLTPVVNNEMVNKNVLSSQVAKGRDVVVDWILSHFDDNEILCMDGYGPEVSIFKSVFKRTGLNMASKVNDAGINAVLDEIIEFISACEQKQNNFAILYQSLMSAPYGMRKGLIPLFIAYALRQYCENVILYYSGKEVELRSSILSSLNDAPESYQLLLESGTLDREHFLDQIEMLFIPYANTSAASVNRIYRIVKSMQNWVRSLPEYTKKCGILYAGEKIEILDANTALIRRELLRFEVNSRELLFKTFAERFSTEGKMRECYKIIENAKYILDDHLASFKAELNNYIKKLFIPDYSGGLSSAIKRWYDDLTAETKTHLFDSTTNEILSYSSKLSSYDDSQVLYDLSVLFTSMAIEDWSDELADQFITDISNTVFNINTYCFSDHAEDIADCNLKISLPGRTIEKRFASSEISALGKTALNNIKAAFEEYNAALEPNEQLAILLTMIKDLLD